MGVGGKPAGRKRSRGWARGLRGSLYHGKSKAVGPKAVGVAVARVAVTILGQHGFREVTLLSQWPTIVGPEVAMTCLPTRLTFHHGGQSEGILSLRVANGSIAIQLQHRTTLLIERINAYFGYAVVGQIRMTQGPLPRRPAPVFTLRPIVLSPAVEAMLTAELAPVRDNALRVALTRLGQSILHRRDQEGR